MLKLLYADMMERGVTQVWYGCWPTGIGGDTRVAEFLRDGRGMYIHQFLAPYGHFEATQAETLSIRNHDVVRGFLWDRMCYRWCRQYVGYTPEYCYVLSTDDAVSDMIYEALNAHLILIDADGCIVAYGPDEVMRERQEKTRRARLFGP